MAALQQLHRFVAGLAAVQLGPAELRTVHQAFIASVCSDVKTPADATALLQATVEYANTAPSSESLVLLRLQRHLIAREHVVTDVFGGWMSERLLKQLTAGDVEHRSEMGVEMTQCLVDLAGASAQATAGVLRFCATAATLPALGPEDALPPSVPLAYDMLAALLTRPPLGREASVADVAQQVLGAVFGASGSLEAALQAASRSLFPAFVAAHKQQPATLKPFLERVWKLAQSVASLSDESVNVSFSWLCQFYPHYFQSGALVDLRVEEAFWALLRGGFLSTSSGVRKKAGYLLKRLLDDAKRGGVACAWPSFEWAPSEAAAAERAWNAFFLLYETTDDFALHLIQDAWLQLETLFDSPAVQPPWLSVLLQRLLRHENPAVKKFALAQLLRIADPRLRRLDEAFVLSPLLQALSDPAVYKGTAGEHIEAEAVPFLARYWRLAASRSPERFLRAFVEAARQHLSSPRITIATAFLASIDAHVAAWDSVAFAALADIVSRKIGNQPHHARARMLEQVMRAVCRFTDAKAVASPRQAAAVLAACPRAFLAERPALRAELRQWQDALGGGHASLLTEVLSGLQKASAAPELEQLEEAAAVAEQAAALLFVREGEAEALARTLLASFAWPAPSAVQAEAALVALGALLPAVPLSAAHTARLLPDLTRALAALDAFATARVLRSLSPPPPADLPLLYSLHANRAFVRALAALAALPAPPPAPTASLHSLAQALLAAATAAVSVASSGAASVEFQKLRGMEMLHSLVSMPRFVAPSAATLTAVMHASVARPKDNAEIAEGWSLRVASFALQKWEAVLALLQHKEVLAHSAPMAVLTEARAALDALVPEMFSTILSVLGAVTPACLPSMDEAAVGDMLRQVWGAALEHADLSVVSSFAAFAFSPVFLPFHEQLRPIFGKVLEFALVTGHPLVPYVAVHFLHSVATSQHVMNYEEEFLQLLLYGPLRTDMDAVRYREAEPLEVSVGRRAQTVFHQDGFVRAVAIAALLHHPQQTLIERVVVRLLDETLALNKRNYRQYTWQHRRAVRMWQVLSLLTQHLHPAMEAPVNQRLWRILDMAHMKSVRQYIDLFAANFLLRFPASVHAHFLPVLAQVNGKLELLGSALGISRELLLHWPRLPTFDDALYHRLFQTLVPYSSCNNLVLRTQAQVAVVKLMQMPGFRDRFASQGDLKLLDALYAYLVTNHECAKYLERYGALFGAGDVLQIVRLPELMLYGVPVAEKLPAAESISLRIIAAVGLSSPEGSALVQNVVPEAEAEAEAHPENTGDTIQKKIEPWADIVVDDQLSRETILLRKRQDIVMCASLVDKIPNLAGLARTSEVFAATAIAIPNGRVESDPQFQQVSVNAEKWIPLLEVPPFELTAWLQQKRSEGYRILAVEQTSNSVSLEAYTFPTHAVLLLGKEKEGIPVEFLHLVDDCIQIPQLGLTRSLNVHVSGAIVLWEYTRQQLLKDQKGAPKP